MLDLMEIFSAVFWLWMMNSPGEDAESTLTRDLARSRSGAASIQRSSPPSTLKISNGGIIGAYQITRGRLCLVGLRTAHRKLPSVGDGLSGCKERSATATPVKTIG